ncbi:hypothetical protein [Pseudoduganella namucuonensis]|uniref:Lysozyme inhibitor LprI N-terminal domain-containing protein n=1 Tax=Pseudoduganella namucuonensis TaxID=1035707 RepID=A0A1I7FGF1_9BURK|nr:hypothetical protein [Pseudoduganella namucuonensis]SFU35204.1 hypothetical protein SAMN05216552_100217 [Pseudoduganella namucuonensis]
MKKVIAVLYTAAACGVTAARGAETDPHQTAPCAQPDFPTRSSSNDGVRRVEQALKTWRACFRAATQRKQSVDEMMASAREYQQVKAKHEAWILATIQHSNGQAYGQLAAARVERDFWENLMLQRGDGNRKSHVRRSDEAIIQQVAGAN